MFSPWAHSDSAPPQGLWVLLSTFHRRRFFLTENTKAALLEVWTLFFYLIKTWIEVGPQQAYGRKSGLTEKRGLEELALRHSPSCLLPNVYGVNKEYAERAIMEHCLCAHPGKRIYSAETISKQNINTKGGVMTNKYSKARKMLFHIQTKQTKVVSPLLGSNWQLSAAHTM